MGVQHQRRPAGERDRHDDAREREQAEADGAEQGREDEEAEQRERCDLRAVAARRLGAFTLETLDGDARVAQHYRLAAVRGHLYEKSGDLTAAVAAFRAAADGTSNTAERNYLLIKAARLRERGN